MPNLNYSTWSALKFDRYHSSPEYILFPFITNDPSKLKDFVDHASQADFNALFLALSAVTEQEARVEAAKRAEAAVTMIHPEGLIYLHANILLVIARQALGSHEIYGLPSTQELIHRVVAEYVKLGLKELSPGKQKDAFVDNAPGREYARLVRTTSLSVRALLAFHVLGTNPPELPSSTANYRVLLNEIERPNHADFLFLPVNTPKFYEIVDTAIDFINNAHADTALLLARARRFAPPEHKTLVDALELASIRLTTPNHAGAQTLAFAQTLLEKCKALANEIYAVTAEGKTMEPASYFYFHPLALTVQTLKDLQKFDDGTLPAPDRVYSAVPAAAAAAAQGGDADQTVGLAPGFMPADALRREATATLKELAFTASKVIKYKRGTWEEAVVRMGRYADEALASAGAGAGVGREIDWAAPVAGPGG